MKTTIVTLSFNQGAFLERAIRSVLDQQGVEIEYIVVDPGSTDNSRDVIERYRSRIARVVLEPDDGPADGLRRGLEAASGELFGYLNADDMLTPGALAQVVDGFRRDPSADVVYGHGWIEDLRRAGRRRVYASPPPIRPAMLAFGGVSILQQSTFFRTAAVRRVGGFNIANRTCWDGELLADLALSGARFRRIDAFLGVFTLHEQSISGSGRLEAAYQRDQERIFTRLTGRGPASGDGARRFLARALKWGRSPGAALQRLGQIFQPLQPLSDKQDWR